jgi:hypothetical protein
MTPKGWDSVRTAVLFRKHVTAVGEGLNHNSCPTQETRDFSNSRAPSEQLHTQESCDRSKRRAPLDQLFYSEDT